MNGAILRREETGTIPVCAGMAEAGRKLAEAGCAYIPGLDFQSPGQMGDYLSQLLGGGLIAYEEDKISPRTQLGEYVYTSTDFSAVADIYLHNECCTKPEWPLYIAFYCKKQAAKGGNTTVSAIREVTRNMPADIADAFARQGIRYTRNLGGKVGNSIAYSFGTAERGAVEAYCRQAGMEVEWLGDEHLRLAFQRAPYVLHPRTGERLWFNNAVFWNPLSLDRLVQRGIRGMPPEALAFNSLLGNGEPIPAEWMHRMVQAYDAARVPFDWSEGGLMVLDNMLFAHGREKFAGDREVWVAMAHTVHRRQVEVPL